MATSEEISLYDIWLIFKKQQKLFWWVVITVIVIGSILTIITPKKANYSQAIVVAQYYSTLENKILPLESIDLVAEKIKKMFIPAIMLEYKNLQPNLQISNILTLTDSNINTVVTLQTKDINSPTKATLYQTLFTNILDKLIANQAVGFQIQQKGIENNIGTLENTKSTYAKIIAYNKDQTSPIALLFSNNLNQINNQLALYHQAQSLTRPSHFLNDNIFIEPIITPLPIKFLGIIMIAIICGIIAIFFREPFSKVSK